MSEQTKLAQLAQLRVMALPTESPMAETLREKQVAMQREYDLAAYSAKLERMECGHLRAELGLYIYDRPGSPPGNAQVCLGCLREQRLVQVVVERAVNEILTSQSTEHGGWLDSPKAVAAAISNSAKLEQKIRRAISDACAGQLVSHATEDAIQQAVSSVCFGSDTKEDGSFSQMSNAEANVKLDGGTRRVYEEHEVQAREQRLVQVVVERAAGICNLKSQEQYISTETRHAMMDADDAIRKLASPENIAEIREQVRKESQL